MIAEKGVLPVTKIESTFNINGVSYNCEHEARTTLWEVLSEKLGLTGTLRSCNKATCGACTVLVNDTPIYSCHYLAFEASGKKLLTVEGLAASDAEGKKLHPLQEIGYRHHAAQCGYCTGGWLIAAKWMLDRNPNLTQEEIKQGLVGHLCRCGSYSAIVKSVYEAAQSMRKGTDLGKSETKPDHTIVVSQPFEREYSTGGGHLPGDWLIEGDKKIKTRKWQGYAPKDVRMVGAPIPPIREVSLPRYLGKATYATNVVLPNMLYLKFLRSPHPHAKVKSIDTSAATRMPGVATVLTHDNCPKVSLPAPSVGLRQELLREGEIIAVVAAESEDIAEDAAEVINVEYEVLPPLTTLAQALSPDAPKLHPDGNLIVQTPGNLGYDPDATMRTSHGDMPKGFAESDVVKEFNFTWAGTSILPMQPNSGVADWDGDKLTYWGYGQDISATRFNLSRTLGIPEENVRYIDMYNGGSFGGTGPLGMALSPLSYYASYIAKITGRPVKFALTKEEELVERRIKCETMTTFKIGAKKDGRIRAMQWIQHQLVGDDSSIPSPVTAEALHTILKTGVTTIPWDNIASYCPTIPNWEIVGRLYRSNSSLHGCNRCCVGGQEIKWGFEQAMDEMAETLGIDPVEFRILNVAKPGQKILAKEYGLGSSVEAENGTLTFDCYASVETLEEGAKAFGWKTSRKPTYKTAGEEEGEGARFKRGMGMAFSDHLGGLTGYIRGEPGFGGGNSSSGSGSSSPIPAPVPVPESGSILKPGYGNRFSTRVELDKDGYVTIRDALPDSGTDHDTPIAMLVAEIFGYTSIDRFRIAWGDSDLAPPSGKWLAGRTTTNAGTAACQAADWIKNELFSMAAKELDVKISELEMQDGVVFSKSDASKKVSFGDLALKAGGSIGATGEHKLGPTGQGGGRAINRTPGSVFVEVEVDTWTGKVKLLNVVTCTDAGNIINPLTSETDQDGAVIQGAGNAFEQIPWDVESHDRLLAGMGYLSYPIPTIKEFPEKLTHVFINSFEPRGFFGFKGFAETSVGAVPAAIANAIYDATGVRLRDHPITAGKILEGLRERLLNKKGE